MMIVALSLLFLVARSETSTSMAIDTALASAESTPALTTVGGKIEITDCELVWNTGQNCFGINRDFYLSNTDLFKDKSPIVAGGTTYYIDAMDLPTNCNSAVALVYVANTVDCADGTIDLPWILTSECGYGGVLTADLSAGDDWHLMPRTGLHPLVEFS